MSAPEIAALALAALVGSAAQSATGFGVALPLAPVAFAILDPADAVLTVAVASLMHNLLVLATRRKHLDLRAADATLLIAAALPGLVLGALIVSRIDKPAMQLAVGVAILAAVLLRLHEPGRAPVLANRSTGAATGLLAGMLTTTVGVNGPPLVMWLRSLGAPMMQMRDTLAVVFLALNLAAILSLTATAGSVAIGVLPIIATGLLIGHVLGSTALYRVDESRVERALSVVLVAAACASIIGAAIAVA